MVWSIIIKVNSTSSLFHSILKQQQLAVVIHVRIHAKSLFQLEKD